MTSPIETFDDLTATEKKGFQLFRKITGWPSQVAAALGTIGIGIIPYLSEQQKLQGMWPWVPDLAFLLSIFFALLGTIGIAYKSIQRRDQSAQIISLQAELKKSQQNAEDAEERSKQRARSISETLIHLGRELLTSLHLDNEDYRISIYREADNAFFLAARWSNDPTLCALGRRTFSVNQGVIGRAWSKKQAILVDGDEDRKVWEAEQIENGLDPQAAQALKMHARSTVGRRLSIHHDPVGVLVIDCLAPDGLDEKTLEAIASSPLVQAIALVMNLPSTHFPRYLGRHPQMSYADSSTF